MLQNQSAKQSYMIGYQFLSNYIKWNPTVKFTINKKMSIKKVIMDACSKTQTKCKYNKIITGFRLHVILNMSNIRIVGIVDVLKEWFILSENVVWNNFLNVNIRMAHTRPYVTHAVIQWKQVLLYWQWIWPFALTNNIPRKTTHTAFKQVGHILNWLQTNNSTTFTYNGSTISIVKLG